MRKNVILLLALTLLWIHCDQPNGINETVIEEPFKNFPLTFEKVKTASFEDMGYPSLYVDEREIGVYGFVKNNGREQVGVYRFDHDLNQKGKKYIHIGQGPGDTGTGTRFYPFEELLLASDNTIRRLTFYDREFNFQKFITLKKETPFYFFKDGEFCISVNSVLKNKKEFDTIHITSIPSFESKKIHEIGPGRRVKRMLGESPGYDFFYHHKNEWVYIINMASYEILTFDLNGVLQKKVKVNTEVIKIGTEEQKTYIKEYLGEWGVQRGYKFYKIVQPASLMVPFEKGFVVIRRNDWRISGDGFCDGNMFDYDLNPIGKVKIPEFYSCYYVEGTMTCPHTSRYYKGYFYLVKETEEDSRLEKWKVSN
jgi:hypothetical protein